MIRFGSFLSFLILSGILLVFPPSISLFAQNRVKYNLGPQLIPLQDDNDHSNYTPWLQEFESNCQNSDFSIGDWTNWEGCYGYFNNPCQFAGFKTNPPHPVHQLISGPGYKDWNTCDSLNNVFPGESFVAKLGDSIYSTAATKAGILSYEVDVTPNSYLFIYRYAVVLQTGGHSANMQPDFQVMITDTDGVVLDSVCGYYYITAQLSGPPVAGWHRCNWASNGAVYWKDWTTVGMDLTPYLGQTIYITFKVRACYYNTHFGYAYISAYCNQLAIQTSLCEGEDSATLTAPPGFSYLWQVVAGGDTTINGDTTASITVPSVEGAIYQCTLTALNGCTVTITNQLHYTQIHAGYTYTPNCAQRPTSFTDTSWVSQNEIVAWRWFFGDPASGPNDSSHLETPTHSFTSAANYTVTLISYSTDGCADTAVKQIAIDTLPAVNNTSFYKLICSHGYTDITPTSNIGGTLYTWTATSTSLLITGFSNQTTPVTYLNQQLLNSGNEIDTVIYNVVPQNGTCTGNDTNFYVAVYPHPNLTNSVRVKSICDSSYTNIILQSNLDTTRFTWTCTASSPNITGYSNNTTNPDTLINQLLRNSGYTIDTVYYNILPQAATCFGDITIYKVAVYPVPDLSNTPRAKAICDSNYTNINLTSHVAGTLFTWRAYGSSPQVTGYSNSTIPGLLINQRLENNSYMNQTVTYRLLPSANGCAGDSVNYVVTVFPRPNLSNSPLSKEICNNNSTNINLTSNVTGALFTWTCTASSGNVTGYSNNAIPMVQISQNLINTGSAPETVTYHIIPQANGCIGWIYHYVVTVIPSPYLTNNPLRKTQCNNQNTNLTLTSNVAGTQFTWTATASSPSLSGYSNSVTPGTIIAQTLLNSGFNKDSVTYHITPVASGCPGSVTDYNVVVFPVPDVYFVPNGQTVCEGVASSISCQSHAAGTTYSWTASASSPNLSGYSNGSGNLIAQVISNAGSTTETVTYLVTPAANGCPPGTAQNVVLTIRPRPVLSNVVTTFQICNGTSISISLQADVGGSTFGWKAYGSSANVSGYSSGSGPQIVQTLYNNGFLNELVTYRVAATASGCTGDSTDFQVTVYPVPDVYFIPPSQSICPLKSTNISNNSHIAGTIYTWTATGSSFLVTGYSPGSGNMIQQTLNNAGNNFESVTYQVSPMANGCPGTPSNVIVTVYPKPVVTLSSCWDPITTVNAQPIILKGGTPINGTYKGKGVTGGILYPAIAGIDTVEITYSYANLYGCTDSAGQQVIITESMFFVCGNVFTDRRDNKIYQTVQIGTQCWMAQNLDFGQQLNGSLTQRDNCIAEKYCYNDNTANCSDEGGLYQWDELMRYTSSSGSQGLCPPEWHVPTENDWNTLFSYYITSGFAGSPLKYTGYSGFNAFLKGVRFRNVSWSFLNFATFFWSSTPVGTYKAWAHGMNDPNPSVSFYPALKSNAFAVRCIRD